MLHEYNSIFLETFTTAFKVCLFSGANIFPEKIAGCFDQIRRVARTINGHQNMPSTAARHLTKKYISYLEPPRGRYLLVKGYWGCAAGWGRIFTTGLTIMELHF